MTPCPAAPPPVIWVTPSALAFDPQKARVKREFERQSPTLPHPAVLREILKHPIEGVRR